MTEDEALAAATRNGLNLSPVKNVEDAYSIGQGTSATGMVQFCDGYIYAVSENIPGGVDAFAATVRDYLGAYGQPETNAVSNYGADGLISYIQLIWRWSNGESATLGLTSWANTVTASTSFSARPGCK